MKILMLTPYVTIDGNQKFERNKTGFGYMVMDIAKAVGKSEDVDVLATDTRGEEFETAGVKFLKRSLPSYILNLFSCLSLRSLIRLRKQYRMSKRTFVRVAYYWLMTGYLCKLIKKNKFDIVHIHGCGFSTELWMQVCEHCGQKYIVTLHGLNSFSDTVRLELAGKQYERDFLHRVAKGDIPITVISSGMKHIIEKTYGVKDCPNIKVVCNSFSFGGDLNVRKKDGIGGSIRELYNIPQDGKILLYVGNISKNKNQQQMVGAYAQLPKIIRDKTWLLFCGRPSQDGSFEKLAKESPFGDHLVLCGSIEKGSIADYYKEADGVVLLSVAEGFGLSLIEGMHFGVPCAMFKDMDAFEDIFDPGAVVPIEDRDNTSVAAAVERLLETSWDKKAIKEYAQKFNNDSMARNYVAVYTKLQQDELL
ncbi:MAG: glycosyltransferase family 4 protein [Prevotella sp.]|nr:glycosyltransferase family 4 protein [Prevotella sp.]